MISIKSKTAIESKALPGVSFTVRTLNKIQRAKRDLPVIATAARMSELMAEYFPLRAIADDQVTSEQLAQKNLLTTEYLWLQDSVMKPAAIRAALVSVDGLEIDGKPATADTLIDASGADYDALIEEVFDACEAAAGLTPTETKNLPSDTTSTGQVEINPTPISAAPVGN